MHNKLVHFKYYKVLILLLLLPLFSLTNVNKSVANTLVSSQNTVTDENYDFVKFDILFGKIFENTPTKILIVLQVNLFQNGKYIGEILVMQDCLQKSNGKQEIMLNQ